MCICVLICEYVCIYVYMCVYTTCYETYEIKDEGICALSGLFWNHFKLMSVLFGVISVSFDSENDIENVVSKSSSGRFGVVSK